MKAFCRGLRVPLLLLVTCWICVVVHEMGHALATFAAGGRVKAFSVLSFRPHVRVQGKFTDAQNALKSVAGSGTFLGAWALFIIALPRGSSRLFEVKAATAFFAFIEVLAWTLSSLTYPRGPKSYDSWKFITFSGLSPQMVTFTCIALLLGGVWLYRHRVINTSEV